MQDDELVGCGEQSTPRSAEGVAEPETRRWAAKFVRRTTVGYGTLSSIFLADCEHSRLSSTPPSETHQASVKKLPREFQQLLSLAKMRVECLPLGRVKDHRSC